MQEYVTLCNELWWPIWPCLLGLFSCLSMLSSSHNIPKWLSKLAGKTSSLSAVKVVTGPSSPCIGSPEPKPRCWSSSPRTKPDLATYHHRNLHSAVTHVDHSMHVCMQGDRQGHGDQGVPGTQRPGPHAVPPPHACQLPELPAP